MDMNEFLRETPTWLLLAALLALAVSTAILRRELARRGVPSAAVTVAVAATTHLI